MAAKQRPTFEILRAELANDKSLSMEQIEEGFRIIADMEAKCIRLIQIQEEQKKLQEEAGYTDDHGHRVPGLKDAVERLFVKYDLFDGVKIEDFSVIIQTGKGPNLVDPVELLRLGVPDDVIKRATREGRGWTTIRVQRSRKGSRE